MKLYAITVLYKGQPKVVSLSSAYNLTSFGYFQKSSVQEFMKFTSRIVVERTQPGLRSTVKEQEYNCHTYVRSDCLSGVVIADHEYPSRVAFRFMSKALDEFATEVSPSTWPSAAENSITFKKLEEYLALYQNPSQADPMMRLQSDLDETKVIMHDTIDAMLQRGEKLDDLVAKSNDLSVQSKTFYKTAKKTNSCCVIQ
ncbi:synaptobrevin homolog YKT6-like [Patiria miniata]|uniref:Synaptobrevin homolog YKT6 n=1 Tax=Patiria miniata TaxID=46514 RepID=A0A914B6D9_PATMI|nr:synaptobrevin homolog YKT6-like [Patiria miniata]XP_038071028.1 synaptobrevin homolog YKT6-like [Patiria miniata]XP_038071085.1 synaptobrevin homolog YKT6-like [Patiria miniata]